MITAIAIDDEPPALRIIENFCGRLDTVDLKRTFNGPHEALRYLHNFPVDLLFLDVQMPGMLGTEFFRKVKQNTLVIFTTAFSSYAIEGFELQAVDYLLKPFTFERFERAVLRAIELRKVGGAVEDQEQRYFLVRSEYRLVRIAFEDIVFLEGLDDYVRIHLDDGTQVVSRMTLKSAQEQLPADLFFRIHRSFVIAMAKIESVRNKMVVVRGQEFPIGRKYLGEFQRILGL